MKALYVGLGVLGVGAVGYLIYKKFVEPQMGSLAVSPYSYPNNAYQNYYVGAQPSEQYPYTAIVPPRVDNTNEPWYGGNRYLSSSMQTDLSSGMDMGFANTVNYINGASTIIGSVKSIWDDLDLGSYFESSSSEDSWAMDDGFNWSSLEFV